MPNRPSSRAGIALASLAVLAATAVSACSPDSGTGETASIPAVPAALSDQKPHWTACSAPSTAQGGGDVPENLPDGTTWQCSTMRAPLDYAHPDDGTIELALVRAKSSRKANRERLGSLVFNFGGPGASGVSTLPLFAEDTYAKLHERYDLVSFDPRGVGDSAGVKCLGTKAMDAWLAVDLTPDDAAEEKAYADGVRTHARSCEDNSGIALNHVGTQDAARDLDLMRHILGDEKLNYFGISYGTQLGGVYAHLFPERVGRTVLDAVVDPTNDTLANGLGQAKGFQGALESFTKDCTKREECFFDGKDPASGQKAVTALLDRLDTKPVPTADGRPLTQSLALNGIAAALYDREMGWTVLNDGLAAAAKGDGSVLLFLADGLNERTDDDGYANGNAAFAAVSCADYSDRFTAADVRRHLPEFREASTVFGVWMAWGLLQCTDWPVAGHAPTVEVTAGGADPVLVIGNTGDPATPYEGAKRMAEKLGKGVGISLTVDGEGHGTYGANDCLTELVDTYLLDGTVPEDNTTCS
ncbi:alpha/beta hydrolase [Streptomyces sp. NPDC002809]|uniref:alpha/beta hydrolase n=1 Tax=Streptomyces sp. NPDC002809 TaxID=3154433 RepID=UPI0033255542